MMVLIDAVALLLGYWALTSAALVGAFAALRSGARWLDRQLAPWRERRAAGRAAQSLLALATCRVWIIGAGARDDLAWHVDAAGETATLVATPRGRRDA